MLMLRIVGKIAAVPVMILCKAVRLMIDLLAKLSCFVLGPLTLFVVGCIIYTIIRQEWNQTFLLVLIEAACYAALFGAGIIATEIGGMGDRLADFIRS